MEATRGCGSARSFLLGVGGVRALHALSIHSGRVASERGPQCLRDARDGSSDDGGGGHAVRRGGARRLGDDGVHDAHAGCGRARSISGAAGRGASGQDPGIAASFVRGFHGAGAGLSRRPQRAILHDGAGAAAFAICQRRQCAARDGFAADVAAAVRQHGRGERADRAHHERDSRADVGCAADASALRPEPRERLAQAPADAGDLGGHQPG